MNTFYKDGKLVQVTNQNPLPIAIVNGGGGGGSSASWHTGTDAPSSDLGKDGDMYLVASGTGAGDVYSKSGGEWTKEGNIRGAKGDKGDTGAKGADGKDGAPTKAEWDALVAKVEALEGNGS